VPIYYLGILSGVGDYSSEVLARQMIKQPKELMAYCGTELNHRSSDFKRHQAVENVGSCKLSFRTYAFDKYY
jgi:hypothetical protein